MQVMDYLLSLGHRRILFVGHRWKKSVDADMDADVHINRLLGYQAGLKKHGMKMDEELIVELPYGDYERYMDIGVNGTMQKLFSETKKPTVICCDNDKIAVPLIAKLQAEGFRVPEDISVIGFDDRPLATKITPALTTVRVPRVEMGKTAAELVLSQMRSGFSVSEQPMLDTELIIRESCGAVPKE
jgi:DNA-binding LacI/PurR family transcriptional regulator